MSFKDKNEPQDTSWNKNPVTAPNRSWVSFPAILCIPRSFSLTIVKLGQGHEDEDEIPERDRKAHVNPYENTAEVGDIPPKSRVLIRP